MDRGASAGDGWRAHRVALDQHNKPGHRGCKAHGPRHTAPGATAHPSNPTLPRASCATIDSGAPVSSQAGLDALQASCDAHCHVAWILRGTNDDNDDLSIDRFTYQAMLLCMPNQQDGPGSVSGYG